MGKNSKGHRYKMGESGLESTECEKDLGVLEDSSDGVALLR